MVETTHQGHATELAQCLSLRVTALPETRCLFPAAVMASHFNRCTVLQDFCGIVCVGGDGVLVEALNGILVREDREEALQRLPLGAIPGGSGNAMAKSLEFIGGRSNGTWKPDAKAAAEAIVAGHTRKLDVTELTQVMDQRNCYKSAVLLIIQCACFS